MRTYFKMLLSLFLMVIVCNAFAQKLPNKQGLSLRIPANLKINGFATEVNDKYQAYNGNVDVFYTIANDNNRLYLVIHAPKPRIIQKIASTGITLTVNKKGEKDIKANENISITYPILDFSTGEKILAGLNIKSVNIVRGFNDTTNINSYEKNKKDSLIKSVNQLLTNNAKNIKVKGLSEISDTLISVYNEEKIRAAGAFDNNGEFTYELSVPLKYLGLSVNDMRKFSYNIKLNGRLDNMKKGFMIVYRYNSNGDQYNVNADLDSATDFWGEYVLAAKP